MIRRSLSVLLVIAVGALTLAVLSPAMAGGGGGGGCHGGTHTQGDTTVVEMSKNCFAPTVTSVDVGDTVEWRNSDPIPHVIAGATGEWGTEEISPQKAGGVRFDAPGVFPYWCSYHIGMIGAVVVGDGHLDSKAASSGPVAVAVEDDPPPGGAAATADGSRARSSSDEGVAPVAAVAIALVAGVVGYGVAMAVRRRGLGVPAQEHL